MAFENFFHEDSARLIEEQAQVLPLDGSASINEDDEWLIRQERESLGCLLSVSRHADFEELISQAALRFMLPKKVRLGEVLSICGPVAAVELYLDQVPQKKGNVRFARGAFTPKGRMW